LYSAYLQYTGSVSLVYLPSSLKMKRNAKYKGYWCRLTWGGGGGTQKLYELFIGNDDLFASLTGSCNRFYCTLIDILDIIHPPEYGLALSIGPSLV
jgi:hypothetical protein